MTEGLVGGDGFAVDASLIRAEANRQRFVTGEEGLPPDASSRAIDENLAVLDDAAFGGATEVVPKRILPSNLAARSGRVHISENYDFDRERSLVEPEQADATRAEPYKHKV